MRRLELTDVATTVAELRSVAPARCDVRAAVEEIVGEVRRCFGSREAPTPRPAPRGVSTRREGGAMTEVGPRVAAVDRTTNETTVSVRLDLDGGGSAQVETGIRFLDHMMELFAQHGGFGLEVRAAGDLDVGGHHTVEDIGLALGQALREAVGVTRGIRRYGFFLLPMDETLVQVAVDLSGRPYFAHNFELSGLRVGDFDAELTSHFFQSLVNEAALTLHIRLISGSDTHHIVSAVFKGVARALGVACERYGHDADPPSTKVVP